MPNPGSLGNVAPRTLDHLYRVVADQQKQIDRLMTQRTLESAIIGKGGLTVEGGNITVKDALGAIIALLNAAGVTIDGDLILNGTETVSGDVVAATYAAGTDGFKLTGSTGNAEFNDITLRGGIIGNDALTNPIKATSGWDEGDGHALSPSVGAGMDPVRAEVVLTVPAGFTSVAIYAAVQDGAWNDSGFPDYEFSCINVGAPGANYLYSTSATVGNGSFGFASTVNPLQITGLSGGDTVSVQSRPFTSAYSWSALAQNYTALSVLALFFR